MMDVGTIFYDTETHQFGEVLFLDGKTIVAKIYIYNPKTMLLGRCGYEGVTEKNKIIGKKHIIEYFEKKINETNLKIGKDNYSKEEIMKKVEHRIQKATRLISEAGVELENISRNQTIHYSETREKQVKCIQKSIRRNMKRINRYQKCTSSVDKKIEILNKEIKRYQMYIVLVKGL